MPYTDKCLGPGGVGILDANDHLTQAARDAFTAQVIALLTSGNEEGKGAKVSSLLGISFPPPSGVKLFDPDRFLLKPDDPNGDLFWFSPSPFAPLTFERISDPKSDYQKIMVTSLYEPLMKLMNQAGNALVPPVIDYSGVLPPDIAVDLTLPDLPIIAALLFPTPVLPGLAAKLDIGLPDVPDIVASILSLVSIPAIPSLPSLPPIPSFDFMVFTDLFLGLLKLPITILPQLVLDFASPLKALDLLIPDPPKLFGVVLELFFKPILELLGNVGLLTILPKLLIATFIVMLQNVVIAMIPLFVSQVIGTGLVVKFLGQALGLA